MSSRSQIQQLLQLLAIAIHIIFVGTGIIILGATYFLTESGDTFFRPLFINVGTSLVAVTIVFSVSAYFRQVPTFSDGQQEERPVQSQVSQNLYRLQEGQYNHTNETPVQGR